MGQDGKRDGYSGRRRNCIDDLAAIDFLTDLMCEENYADFICQINEVSFICGDKNTGYLDMVINKKRGWVLDERKGSETKELPPASSLVKKKRE